MFTLIFLALLCMLLWVGFHITGALLLAFIWLFIKLPIAFAIFMFGLVCCCTLILIPLGLIMFRAAFGLMIPCV